MLISSYLQIYAVHSFIVCIGSSQLWSNSLTYQTLSLSRAVSVVCSFPEGVNLEQSSSQAIPTHARSQERECLFCTEKVYSLGCFKEICLFSINGCLKC